MIVNAKKNKQSEESISRKLALSALLTVEKGQYAEQSLNEILHGRVLSREDRNLVTELVYGVTRNRSHLDHIISQFLKNPGKKISHILRNILRMGVYQIIYLDRIPVRAIVNEATLQAKRLLTMSTSGFVNGLLRNVSANSESIRMAPKNSSAELSKYYSHPEWLVKRWFDQYGPDQTVKILEFNNSRPSLVFHANTHKISFGEFLERLKQCGLRIGAIYPEFSSLEITSLGQPVSTVAGFEEGLFLVQDLASQLVPSLLKPLRGHRILDACAAPGNKAFHLAPTPDLEVELVLCDINPNRLAESRQNLQRLGVGPYQAHCMDCSDSNLVRQLGEFDRILVDAPCSSLGVLRHNPEVKYTVTPNKLREHSAKQLSLLKSVSKTLKPNGLLVYSVCSVSTEETLGVVQQFLKDEPSLVIDPISPNECTPFASIDGNGFLFTFPPDLNQPMDGFFAARFCRV